MPLPWIGRTKERHHWHAVRCGDVRQTAVDAHAEIHPCQQAAHPPQRHRGRVIVNMADDARGKKTDDLRMQVGIRRTAAEEDLTAAYGDQPFDHGHPAVGRPVLLPIGRTQRQEDPRPPGGHVREHAVEWSPIPFAHPVLIVAVIDVDAVATQQVEVGLRLMTTSLHAHGPGQQPAPSLRHMADPPRDASQPDKQRAGERPLEEIGPGIPARPQPFRTPEKASQRLRHETLRTRRPRPGHQFVGVGTVGQNRRCGWFDQHVDDRPWKPSSQVAEEGNAQHRVAEEAVADHEDPLGLCRRGWHDWRFPTAAAATAQIPRRS